VEPDLPLQYLSVRQEHWEQIALECEAVAAKSPHGGCVIPVTQSRVGVRGTCFRAALASILNLAENQVPDFKEANLDPAVNEFLSEYGLPYARRPATLPAPQGYHVTEGVSPRGGQHAVVGRDGHFVHDPHPQDGTGRGLQKVERWGELLPDAVEPGRDTKTPSFLSTRKHFKAGDPQNIESVKPVKLPGEGPRHLEGRKSAACVKDVHRLCNSLGCTCECHKRNVKDRQDMMQLRRNTEKQGGPFNVQLTEPDGREHVEPVGALRAYDSVPAWAAILLAFYAWYKERQTNAQPINYDLTTYQPPPRNW
jgi:hypothetical protein